MKSKFTKKIQFGLLTGAICILTIGTNAVLAGEVNGKGDKVPGGENGRSLCSFSGQQDDAAEDEGTFRGDLVQSWGQIPQELRDFLISLDMYFHPGEGCNPNKPNPPL